MKNRAVRSLLPHRIDYGLDAVNGRNAIADLDAATARQLGGFALHVLRNHFQPRSGYWGRARGASWAISIAMAVASI